MPNESINELFNAIEANDRESVQRSLARGADVNQFNESQQTPLIVACEAGNNGLVNLLLKQPGISITLDDGSPNYRTALAYAIDGDYEDIVGSLANQPLHEEDNMKLLVYYAKKGNIEGVQTCLSKQQEGYKVDINSEQMGEYAILNAATFKHTSIVELLLKQPNLDLNLTNHLGETLLIIAVNNNDIVLFNYIISQPNVNFYIQSYKYGTALTAAVFHQNYDLAEKLIEKEMSFDIKKHPGCFNWAVQFGNLEFISLLINRRADVNALGNDNYEEAPDWVLNSFASDKFPFKFTPASPIFELPLIIALKQNNAKVFKLLLSKEADINKKGATDRTPQELLNYASDEFKNIIKLDYVGLPIQTKSKISSRSLTFFEPVDAKDSKKIVLDKESEKKLLSADVVFIKTFFNNSNVNLRIKLRGSESPILHIILKMIVDFSYLGEKLKIRQLMDALDYVISLPLVDINAKDLNNMSALQAMLDWLRGRFIRKVSNSKKLDITEQSLVTIIEKFINKNIITDEIKARLNEKGYTRVNQIIDRICQISSDKISKRYL